MRRWVKVVLAAAGALLLLANGACALGFAVTAGSSDGYAGLGPLLLGVFTFLGAVPLALVALAWIAARERGPAIRPRVLGLLVASLAGGAIFWLVMALEPPLTGGSAEWWPIALFAASAVAAAALLAQLPRLRA